MKNFALPYFEQLQLDSLEKYYSTKIELNGTTVRLDLNFEDKTAALSTMKSVKKIIDDIPRLDKQNKVYIDNDFNDENGDTVRFYLEHHLEVADKQELSTLIDFNDKGTEPEKQLLAKLHLIRIGLYPNNDENFAVFDYSLGESFTNYLVVINLNIKGKLDYMTMES
ncbi:MAG: DUF2004 domain-containing protein [Hymenobacter sp.]|nr:MAG: DUF2004 domain-containing protein [Hymenobacter sp.]